MRVDGHQAKELNFVGCLRRRLVGRGFSVGPLDAVVSIGGLPTRTRNLGPPGIGSFHKEHLQVFYAWPRRAEKQNPRL